LIEEWSRSIAQVPALSSVVPTAAVMRILL
jgi:hypothetical protein